MKDKLPKLGVIFLGRRRPGFDMEWGRQMEGRVREWIGKAGYSTVEPADKVVDDASLRATMATFEKQSVDAIVVLQCTMGDGRIAPTLAQLWPDPIILWATPENQSGEMISSCSLVGAHCWASVLRQMEHSFELVYGDPDDQKVRQRFNEQVRLAATVRGLRKVRVGVIGGNAPGYFAMASEPFSMHQNLGVTIQNYSLIEFSNVAQELKDEAIAADVAAFKKLGIPHKDTTDEDLPQASRLYLTMRSFMDNENLDALTIREWPEMPNTFSQWPYLGVARLCDEGRAIGIEGDADGALCAWIVESLGMGRCYLSDWLEHDSETITLWHGGAAPFSMCSPVGTPGGPRIAKHFNIKKAACVEATIRENLPITVYRFWRLNGKYYFSAREGETIKPKRHLMMTNALARMKTDPGEWFETLCYAGMPHHVAVIQGHHAKALERLSRVLKIEIV